MTTTTEVPGPPLTPPPAPEPAKYRGRHRRDDTAENQNAPTGGVR